MSIRAMMTKILTLLAAVFLVTAAVPPVQAQQPLQLTLRDGVIEALPFALPTFQAEVAGSEQMAADISRVVTEDLTGTGLFRPIPASAFISTPAGFGAPVAFADWRAINAQALVTGAVAVNGNQVTVKFRLYDVFSGAEMGEGLQFVGTADGWRRMAHKVADVVYSRITGEEGYFDSRVVFIAETGPKDNRAKRVAIMDYDGANVQYLTDSSTIVLAPRFSPNGDRLLYTSYESGFPRINILNVATVARQQLGTQAGDMAFSPRFSLDGRQVIYSLTTGGNTDIWRTDLASGQHQRLTNTPAIETAPSFSPDGSEERLLTSSFLDEGPTWAPNGRVIMFARETQGADGTSALYSVDITGRNLRRVSTPQGGSDPSWGPLQP